VNERDPALWDWDEIRRADARARARVAKLPACPVCGGHLTCGQFGVHHACDPDWPTYELLRTILEASA
jgi:hypothetical protein